MKRITGIAIAALLSLPAPDAVGQIALIRNPAESRSNTEFRIKSVDVNADIKDQVATVQIAQTFHNVSRRTLETQFLFPMPEGAAINGLTLIVDGKELTGELKPKGEARKVYEEIVRRQQDPALLEYMDRGLFKTSVFPIPAGQSRRVEIKYTQLLKSDTGLVDFTLPLGTAKHTQAAVEKTTVVIRIRSSHELKNVYSPTHDFDIDRSGEKKATCRLSLNNIREPDDVRLLYGTHADQVGMNLVTYKPDDQEQGYFLMLATPRVKTKKESVIPKTVLFVVDRSGSMAGEKLKQAKASLTYMINSLNSKDTFNIISYSSEVDLFRPELELFTDETRKQALEYIDDIYSGGGTNINEALTSALEQLTDSDRPNYVMFLTDGLPTVGVTGEADIAANVRSANKIKARVFSFGVGYDVNSRLLDRLSRDQRGTSVYVKPEEDIEIAATNLFRKVSSPAMTKLEVAFHDENSGQGRKPVNRVYPTSLPDLFRGEQLIVVGRYRKAQDVTVKLSGMIGDKRRTMKLETEFGTPDMTRRNGFVETLWATRRIGEIIDDLDLNGHNDELVKELVDLSLRHGIMTPYTSFLAEEEVSFGDRDRLMTETRQRSSRGLSLSAGREGFVQREFKQSLQKSSRGYSDIGEADEAGQAAELLARKFGLRPSARSAAPAAADRSAVRRSGSGFGGAAQGGAPNPGSGNAPTSSIESALGVYATDAAKDEKQKPAKKIRRIGNKTFYWKSSEWQDAAVINREKQPKTKEIIVIKQFSREYFELTQLDNSRWSQYLTLAEPVLISIKDRIYRIVPPKKN